MSLCILSIRVKGLIVVNISQIPLKFYRYYLPTDNVQMCFYSFEIVKIIHDKLLDITGKTQYVQLSNLLCTFIKEYYHLEVVRVNVCCWFCSLPLALVGNKTDLRMER